MHGNSSIDAKLEDGGLRAAVRGTDGDAHGIAVHMLKREAVQALAIVPDLPAGDGFAALQQLDVVIAHQFVRQAPDLTLADVFDQRGLDLMAEIGIKGEAHLADGGRLCQRERKGLRRAQRRGDPAVGRLAHAAGIAVDDIGRFAARRLARSRDRRAARKVGFVGVRMAGDIAVVFQQRLLQLTDVLLPYLARVAPVADGQRGSRARGLTADGAGTHDAGGREGHFGGADIAAGQHEVF